MNNLPDAAWPLYATAAAVMVKMPNGDMGIRVIQGHQIAASGDAARNSFIQGLSEAPMEMHVLDFSVSEIPRHVIQMALQVGEFRPGPLQ